MTAANESAPSTSQIVVSMLAMPPRENRSSIWVDARVAHEPGRHRGVAGLRSTVATGPRLGSSTNALTASHWGTAPGCRRRARTRGWTGTAGIGSIAKTTSSSSGSRLRNRDVERRRQRRASRIGADLGLRVRVQPQHEEDDEADARAPVPPSRTCSGCARPTRQPAADELGDQDRRLRQRRHLVAEVGAADDRPGGDGLVEAHHVAMPTKATPRVPAVVQELPVTMPTRAHTTAAVR